MTKFKIILLLLITFSVSLSAQQDPVDLTKALNDNGLLDTATAPVNTIDQKESAPFSPVQTNSQGVAIDGFDPVAYFDQNQAVKGSAEFNCEYQNTVWHFSHRQKIETSF